MCFDSWLMIHSFDFREFPVIPDRDVVRKNIYNWFKYWLRRHMLRIVLEMMIRQTGKINEELSDEIINEKFSDEVDEETTEVISCKVCLVNTLKVVFSCGHCTCIGCANKLNDCHICRKKISKKARLYL